ncbi:MAG: YlbF family regulator [Planctomycetota bacterium]|jgi:cell fate (sporulation/competence/biofilm development) regulator YlbF (YheA/YmcA/DUF963 family)|nr:YlbF family regulator [Planctomycetota bacterium]MDP6506949.1 YlbF family regulator [Planctomycetota bacterium]
MIDFEKDDIRQILDLAERLGQSISSSDRFKALQEITAEIEGDEETSRLVKEYSRLKLRAIQGDEGDEQDQRLREVLERRIRESPKIAHLLKTQAEFAELMSKVRSNLADSLGSHVETGI